MRIQCNDVVRLFQGLNVSELAESYFCVFVGFFSSFAGVFQDFYELPSKTHSRKEDLLDAVGSLLTEAST